MTTSNTHWVNLSQDSTVANLSHAPFDSAARPVAAPSASQVSEASRTLAGMLLAASMAALLVVADQVIDTWTDGHLLAGWVALWTVAFAGLALLAPPLRKVAAFAAGGCFSYWATLRAEQEEARMWELASHDPRVLEEIRAAMVRYEDAA